MANHEKQRFYPVRDKKDPQKVSLIPITEETYRSIYPEIWRTQKQMQKLGRCGCPKSMLWSCDADCGYCEFYAKGNQESLDAPLGDSDDLTLADILISYTSSPEEIVIYQAVLESLYDELAKLDPEGQKICKLLMEHSEREAAAIIGMPRSTFKRRWAKIKDQLFDSMKDWF